MAKLLQKLFIIFQTFSPARLHSLLKKRAIYIFCVYICVSPRLSFLSESCFFIRVFILEDFLLTGHGLKRYSLYFRCLLTISTLFFFLSFCYVFRPRTTKTTLLVLIQHSFLLAICFSLIWFFFSSLLNSVTS